MSGIFSSRGALTVASAALFVSASLAAAQSPLRPESFRELHALIKPTAVEQSWVGIPWMTSLWDARVRAAAEGKPIVLWEMDGHPLGCT